MTEGGPVTEDDHKIAMTVYLTTAQLDRLKQLRDRTKVTMRHEACDERNHCRHGAARSIVR